MESGVGELIESDTLSNGEYKYCTGSSRTQTDRSLWRSKTLTDYNELPTAELLEDVSSQDDCELVSVVVTQPETYGNPATLPIESRQRTKPCTLLHATSRYSMEELEEFLQSVESCLPKSLHAFQQAEKNEIEALLNVIALCPENDPVGHFSTQVPKKLLSLFPHFAH